jgi:hypothetical protein
MSDINQRIKELAEPGVMQVIQWALMVNKQAMWLAIGVDDEGHKLTDGELTTLRFRFSDDEREQARKILLDYGAGKPTRVIEHKGKQKHLVSFEKHDRPQLSAPPFAPAEVVKEPVTLEQINEIGNSTEVQGVVSESA